MDPVLLFVLAALVIVALLVAMRLRDTRRCPFCRAMVAKQATVCRSCGRDMQHEPEH